MQRSEHLAYPRVMRDSLLVIGLAAALLAGCDPNSQEKDDLAESRSVWLDMKAADDGRYQYTRSDSSWTGYRETTTFLVEDDVVVRRSFEAFDRNGELVRSFEEEGAEVGSSEGADAAPALIIDELYEICRDEVLAKDPDDNIIYLGFRDDGILEYCSYVPRDCADDCSEGVDISDLDMSL